MQRSERSGRSSGGRVFRALFVTMAGLVPARVVDPEFAQQVVGIIAGMGG